MLFRSKIEVPEINQNLINIVGASRDPGSRAKMDAVPGVITYYWFEPNKVGEYEVLCAEYCGVGHYAMRGKVFVKSEQEYDNWLKEQETFSDLIAKQEKIEVNEIKMAKK